MDNIIFFEKEKEKILRARDLENLNKSVLAKREKISNEIYLLSQLYKKGSIDNVDIVLSFGETECYYGEKTMKELSILKDRIDSIKKEIKFE